MWTFLVSASELVHWIDYKVPPTTRRKAPPPPAGCDALAEPVVFGDEAVRFAMPCSFRARVARFDGAAEKWVALVEDVDNLTSPIIAILRAGPSTRLSRVEDHLSGARCAVPKALKYSSGNLLAHLASRASSQRCGRRRAVHEGERSSSNPSATMRYRDIAKQLSSSCPSCRAKGSLIDCIPSAWCVADSVRGEPRRAGRREGGALLADG